MVFISNSGKSKTVKSLKGLIITIPSGAKSFVNDPVLSIAVKNSKELTFLTQDEFLKLKSKPPVKKKVKEVNKNKQEPEKKKKESAAKKKEDAAKESKEVKPEN